MQKIAKTEMPDNSLPCPFCGEAVKIWETGYGVVSIVECENCKTRYVFPFSRKGNTLFEFWNRRASGEVKE